MCIVLIVGFFKHMLFVCFCCFTRDAYFCRKAVVLPVVCAGGAAGGLPVVLPVVLPMVLPMVLLALHAVVRKWAYRDRCIDLSRAEGRGFSPMHCEGVYGQSLDSIYLRLHDFPLPWRFCKRKTALETALEFVVCCSLQSSLHL